MFVGRVTAEAIAAVVGAMAAVAAPEEAPAAGDERNTLKRLVSLAEKSLLLPARSDEEEAGADEEGLEPAFGMLETVREYARERLAAACELAAAAVISRQRSSQGMSSGARKGSQAIVMWAAAAVARTRLGW